MMRFQMFNFLFVLGCLWLSVITLYAQDPYAIRLTTKENLPSNSVFQIFQDSKGFVWIASNEGISRYDGFEFVNYTSEKQSSKAGSYLTEDSKGRIWYGNFDGNLFYVENDRLEYFSKSKTLGYFPFCISEKHLFIIAVDGIEIYDINSLALVKKVNKKFKEIEHAICINNELVFTSDHILYKLNSNLELSSNTYFLGKSIKSKQLLAVNGKIYVYSKFNDSKQIYSFENNLTYSTAFEINEPEFIQGSNFINDQIWLFTSKGIYTYEIKNNTVVKNEKLFVDKNVSNGMIDRQGNYWISTLHEGVYLVTSLENKVYSFQNHKPNKIISTPQGLLMSTQTGSLVKFDATLKNSEVIYQEAENNSINYIHYDALNKEIIYTSKELNFYSSKDKKKTSFAGVALKGIVRIDHKYFGVAVSGFYGLIIDPENRSEKSSVWDEVFARNKIKDLPSVSALKIDLRAKSIDYNAKQKSMVIATNEGLFMHSLIKNIELRLRGTTFYGEKALWYENTIYSLDTKGNLYKITTNSQFELLNPKLDIPNYGIKRIKKIGNELLIITSQSIYIYNLSSKSVQLLDFQLNYASYLDIEKQKDKIYILTTEGLIQVACHKNLGSVDEAQFILNHIKVNHKRTAEQNNLVLAYNQNNVSVNFSVIDFGKTKSADLYYRLNNGEWMKIDDVSHTLLFSSLSAGKYLLEFKIGNRKVDRFVDFEISRPFWFRWWFVSVGVLLFLLSAYLYYKWRMNKLSVQIELLKEKVNLEQSLSKSILTAVKSQMNPHFFYNALNTIQAYIFTNDNKKANTYLAKFSKLTRTVLEMSERDTITLSEEFTALNLYLELEKMRFSKNFEYTFHKEEIGNPDIIEIPPMLIQPYVENAIKHGLLHREGIRTLDIAFKKSQDNLLLVIIDDNGIGRVKADELNQSKKDKSRSFSTEANKKRLEILNSSTNKSIEIIDKYNKKGEAIGTKVILNIQIN